MSHKLTQVSVVPWEQQNGENNLVTISNQLCQQFQLQKNRELTLRLGKKCIRVKVQIAEIPSNEILMPEKIIKEFCLPINQYKFLAKYEMESDTLVLGPIIGLLTDFQRNGELEPNFRSIHTFCEELHLWVKENGGFFYVFSFEQFPQQGFYYENEKWTLHDLPLPDVVYNRIHSRRLEKANAFQAFRNRLEQYNIPIFNDRFLSKWEVYEQLIQEKQLNTFIPETNIFTEEILAEFLQKYNTVFIKPVHGSQGRNIIKITKEDDNHFHIQSTASNKTEINGYEALVEHLKIAQGSRISIIQQGIPLLTIDECNVDFRALCHKNLHDHWNTTSLVARISQKDEFVSNIARGGTVKKPLQALISCMKMKLAQEIIAQIKELAIETSTMISRYSPGITGELGIDIGVTSEGKLWLIEVNSKPSKKFEDSSGKIRPSAKAILQFSTKLAFDTTSEKEEF